MNQETDPSSTNTVSPRRNRAGSLIWRLVICGLLLVWIFHSIFMNEGQTAVHDAGIDWKKLDRFAQWRAAWTHGPRELWHTLTRVPPGPFAVSVALVGVALFLGMARWRLVLRQQGIHLTFSRTMEISFVAHFFNSFLLGSAGGDILKAYYAARETHHLKAEAVTTVLLDRLIGLLSMVLFASLMMLPHWRWVIAHNPLAAPACVILAMLAALMVLAAVSLRGGISRRWPAARIWLRRAPKAEIIERVLDTCRNAGRDTALLLKSVALSMALNTVCVLQFLVLARALGLEVSASILFFFVPTIVCIAALPITPSGLGVRENLFVAMMAVPGLDISPTLSLSLSLLAYSGSLAWSLFGGLVYAFFKQRHHLDEVAHES